MSMWTIFYVQNISSGQYCNSPTVFIHIWTAPWIGHFHRKNIFYERLYGQYIKDIKWLISGKNKPQTEIGIPMREWYFYRCCTTLLAYIPDVSRITNPCNTVPATPTFTFCCIYATSHPGYTLLLIAPAICTSLATQLNTPLICEPTLCGITYDLIPILISTLDQHPHCISQWCCHSSQWTGHLCLDNLGWWQIMEQQRLRMWDSREMYFGLAIAYGVYTVLYFLLHYCLHYLLSLLNTWSIHVYMINCIQNWPAKQYPCDTICKDYLCQLL